MPFTRITLKYLKLKPFQNPQTLGQHLRTRRYELGLYLRQAAIPLGVTPSTLMNWEKGHSKPEMQNWPAIIAYLGYDPFSDPKSLGEELQRRYRQRGLSRKAAARHMGLDEGTLRRHEKRGLAPTSDRIRQLIANFLAR